MASRKATVAEVAEVQEESGLTLVPENSGDVKSRTRRTFSYNPGALGVTAESIQDEPEDFVPVRSRTKVKQEEVRWLEPILADSYQRDVWKGVTVATEDADAMKQGIMYAVASFFDNLGVNFNIKDAGIDDNGINQSRVSFKMTYKRVVRRRNRDSDN